MGGIGSGRYRGAKATPSDYRSIDVRRWNRDGWLAPHQSFVCQWSRQSEVVSAIHVRTEPGRVLLTYRRGKYWYYRAARKIAEKTLYLSFPLPHLYTQNP